jgi:hypothetical protein
MIRKGGYAAPVARAIGWLATALAGALLGCATGGGGARATDLDLLARIRLRQDLEPAWHLRSIAAMPFDDAPADLCPDASGLPIKVALVYERADPAASVPLTLTTCLTPYTRPVVGVHDTPGGTIAAGPRPAESTPAKRAAGDPIGNAPTVVRARLVTRVPADIPRGVQVAMAGEKLRYSIETCLDATGAVTDLRLVVPRHLAEVDGRVLDALRRWKYEPATINGRPTPSCTWAVLDL